MAGYFGLEMVQTPWGDSSTLRERRLSPGRGTPREVARRNQRERLLGAMVAVTAEKPYAETSVADLVEVSGVSSRSFYQLFADKEECFLATMEEILGNVQRLAEDAVDNDEADAPSPHQLVETFVAMVNAQPAAAKLCMVSAFSAGDRPRERVIKAIEELSALVRRGLEGIPRHDGMPTELAQAILSGISLVLYRRLGANRIEGLRDLGPRLSDWVVSIPPPPGPFRPRSRRNRSSGERGPPPLAAHVPAERILRGFAEVVVEKGYAATTIADVAARARISQNTFYKHFRDKAHALEAALDSSGAQMLAAAAPAVRREPAWPGAVRVALEALCAFMAAEPIYAYLREVEVYAIGPEAVALRDRARGEVVEMLANVAESEQVLKDFDPIAVEATLGVFQALLYTRIQSGRLQDLVEVPPLVTYLGFAPVIGAQEAWKIASG